MSEYKTNPSETDREQFDVLYADLAGAWESHQELRKIHPPIAELALSSLVLDEARAAMWSWWKANRIGRA